MARGPEASEGVGLVGVRPQPPGDPGGAIWSGTLGGSPLGAPVGDEGLTMGGVCGGVSIEAAGSSGEELEEWKLEACESEGEDMAEDEEAAEESVAFGRASGTYGAMLLA